MTQLATKPTGITYADRPAEASFAVEQIRPCGDQVLVLYDFIRDARKEERMASGLIVPHSARKPERDQACWATVKRVGPGRYMDKFLDQERGTSHVGSATFLPTELKPGDRVLLQGPTCGDAIMVDGLEHRMVVSDVVIGVEEDDAAE